MIAPRRVGRLSRPERIAAWWRRTLCGLRGHQWQEVRVISDAELRDGLAVAVTRAAWIVRCMRPRCAAVRSWSGPLGRHRQADQG